MSGSGVIDKIFHPSMALALLLAASPAMQAQNQLSPEQASAGWLNLFDGTSTYGWDSSTNWSSQDQLLTAPMNWDLHIVTALPFADFDLTFEYRLNATPSGAAIRIRASHTGEPANSGYRIPLGDVSQDWPAGSIVSQSKSAAPNPELNVWHSVAIEASGGHIIVRIDGKQTAETTDEASKAGYILFENTRGVRLDLRNIYLKPLNLNSPFDGADLSGWKNVPYVPKEGAGVGHQLGKMFGAGKSKPHSANWSVRGGAIHGENGPGSLETAATYGDFVLQVSGSAEAREGKKNVFPAIYLRNDAGTIATGYPLGIGIKSGELRGFAKPRTPIAAQPLMPETVVAGGHVFGIFLNGVLETLYIDTRPDGPLTKTGAKTKAGTISLNMPDDIKSIDLHNIAVENIPAAFGGVVQAAAPAPPPAAPPVTPASAASQPASADAQAAQLAAALGTPSPQARRQVAQLMSHALTSNDPQQQMQLYDQVVRIDPTNAAAVQGYKDAAAKIAAEQQQQQQMQTQTQQQKLGASERDRQVSDALIAAQSAFLGGNLKQADTLLRVAERLAPSNPVARDLRSRVNAGFSLRHRLFFLGSGLGGLALLSFIILFWRRQSRVRFPVLHVVYGLDQGRLFPVDRDVVRIGGITQSGGQKNDIVIQDVEHMISRFHCEVHKKDGTFYLIDTNSSNGTNVNGRLVRPNQPVVLRKGAKIDLGGSAVLQFDFEKKKQAAGDR
jgi:hypothetical protein